MDSVTKTDVERHLAQFSIDVYLIPVCARVGVEEETIRSWFYQVAALSLKQWPELLAAVKEELYRSAARAGDSRMTSRVAGVRRRTFGICLGQKVRAMLREDPGQHR